MAMKAGGLTNLIYDGSTCPHDFKKSFGIHVAYNEWNNARQLVMLPTLLKDKAERLWNALAKTTGEVGHEVNKTAIVLLDELVTGCEQQKETLLYQFYQRVRQPNESISRFANTLQELLTRAMPTLGPEHASSLLRAQLCLHVPQELRSLIQFSSTFGTSSWDNLLACLDKTCPQSLVKSESLNRWDSFGTTSLIKNEAHLIKEEPVDAFWSDSRSRNQQSSSNEPKTRRFEGTCDFCKFYGHKIEDCRKRARLIKEKERLGRDNHASNTSNYSRPTSNQTSNFKPRQSNINLTELDYKSDLNENSLDINSLHTERNENEISSDEFPFFLSESFGIEILTLSAAPVECGMLVRVKFRLFGQPEQEVLALLDSGSTHSFLSPRILSSKQEDLIRSPKNKYGHRRNYQINGATGSSKASCFLTEIEVFLGTWSGIHSFVISGAVTAHAMVLGRDFLKKFRVNIDFDLNCLRIGTTQICINTISAHSANSAVNEKIEAELKMVKQELAIAQEKLAARGAHLVPANENAIDLLGLDFKNPLIAQKYAKRVDPKQSKSLDPHESSSLTSELD